MWSWIKAFLVKFWNQHLQPVYESCYSLYLLYIHDNILLVSFASLSGVTAKVAEIGSTQAGCRFLSQKQQGHGTNERCLRISLILIVIMNNWRARSMVLFRWGREWSGYYNFSDQSACCRNQMYCPLMLWVLPSCSNVGLSYTTTNRNMPNFRWFRCGISVPTFRGFILIIIYFRNNIWSSSLTSLL